MSSIFYSGVLLFTVGIIALFMQIPLNYSLIEKGLCIIAVFIGIFGMLAGLFGFLIASLLTLLLVIVVGLLFPKS